MNDEKIQKLHENNAELQANLEYANAIVKKLSNEIGTLKTNSLIYELNFENTKEKYENEIKRLNSLISEKSSED